MRMKRKLAKVIDSRQPVYRGKVQKITESSIFVSSPVGLKEFQVASPSSFSKGDNVKFQGNNYLGRIPNNISGKIYVV